MKISGTLAHMIIVLRTLAAALVAVTLSFALGNPDRTDERAVVAASACEIVPCE